MGDEGIGPSGYHVRYYLDRDWRSYADLLARIVRYSLPGPILDLGAGCGFLVEAASHWGMESVGLEGSTEAVELAHLRNPKLNISIQRLSEGIPYSDESFQTVVLNQVIEHLSAETAAHITKESFRVLRNEGMLIITAPSKFNKKEKCADPTHINLMSPAQLKRLLVDCGFDRIIPFDAPLPLLGRGRLASAAMEGFFRLVRVEWLSATTNVMAFKSAADVQRPSRRLV